MFMKYAVVRTGGKQYRVEEGETLDVEKIEGEKGGKIDLDDVLMIVDGEKVDVGCPNVKGAKVKLEIVEQKKGDKIRVAKFKAKSRYRKVMGHRQLLMTVKILKIEK